MIPRIAWLLGTRRLAIGLWRAWFCLATTLALAELMALPAQAGSITLQTRWRTGSTNLADATAHAGTVTWEASKTAVVVCDMWDQHHCPDATERVGEMAPAMNEVLLAARARGMLILHCSTTPTAAATAARSARATARGHGNTRRWRSGTATRSPTRPRPCT